MRTLGSGIYQELFAKLPIGVFLLDGKGVIFEWNGWLASSTNITKLEACGKKLEEIFPSIQLHRFNFALEQVVLHSHPQVMSQILNHYLIPIPLSEDTALEGLTYMQQSVSLFPVVYQKEKYAMVVVLDATESFYQRHTLLRVAKRFEEESVHDALTGLYNRRFLWEHLGAELSKASRENYEVICTMYDLDYFKLVNDELGHEAGDEVLLSFADIIKNTLRAGDKAFRYGGEEFITISSYKKGGQADVLANRIRLAIGKKTKHHGVKRVVTCSAGVAVASSLDTKVNSEELVSRADKALYKAKESGRNQVCVYGDHQASSSRGGRVSKD